MDAGNDPFEPLVSPATLGDQPPGLAAEASPPPAAVEDQDGIMVYSGGDRRERRRRDAIQPYDFRNPAVLSARELRRLRLRHLDFVRSLSARLSIELRAEFSLELARLQTVPYGKFIAGLVQPTYVSLFKADPLPGVSLLEVHPRLGLALIDRLLGGPGNPENAQHEFTEIELALLEQVVQVIVDEWCTHWRSASELRPGLLGYETNGRFIQTAPPDTVMVVLSMEARLGECSETLQMAFPHPTVEPLIRTLRQASDSASEERSAPRAAKPRWNPQLDELSVPISAGWDHLELTARELSALKVGDILELSAASTRQVSLRMGDRPCFRGCLGTQGSAWAVQLTEVLRKQA
jgi:flagellar motor switch protein FliM